MLYRIGRQTNSQERPRVPHLKYHRVFAAAFKGKRPLVPEEGAKLASWERQNLEVDYF
jgi:hypothetical protein